MRHVTFLFVFAPLVTACIFGQADPPLLRVSSPQRSLILDGAAGTVTVTGVALPNAGGAAVESVSVNGTVARIGGDGAFTVSIRVPPGGSLIQTVATDADGGVATDTRSVVAGERRASGTSIPRAIAAQLSPSVFAQIGEIAGRTIKATNLTAAIQPLNPIVNAGNPGGCFFGQAFIDTMTITDAAVSLVPAAGGLALSARFQQPVVTGRMSYAVGCSGGTSNFSLRANSATVNGTLVFEPGSQGLAPRLDRPSFQLPGLQITASGIPDAVLGILPLEGVINAVAPAATRLFVDPMIKDALVDLQAPIQLAVLGKMVTVQGAPSMIAFSPAGSTMMLDLRFGIAGGEGSRGFTFTPNGVPVLTPRDGLGLGIADDLINEAIAQLTATGLLDVTLPFEAGEFDTVKLAPTTPPQINADAADGRLKLLLPDMAVTFLRGNTPVASASVNGQIAVAVRPADGGGSVAIDLGQASIAIDATGDDTGLAMPPGSSFAAAIDLGASDQSSSIQLVIGAIPLPKLGEITLSDASITGDSGYVKVLTTLQ